MPKSSSWSKEFSQLGPGIEPTTLAIALTPSNKSDYFTTQPLRRTFNLNIGENYHIIRSDRRVVEAPELSEVRGSSPGLRWCRRRWWPGWSRPGRRRTLGRTVRAGIASSSSPGEMAGILCYPSSFLVKHNLLTTVTNKPPSHNSHQSHQPFDISAPHI